MDLGMDGDDKSKIKEAIKIVSDKMGNGWKELARQLGFEKTDIDSITYENPTNLRECIYCFFSQWQQREGNRASVKKLVDGLIDANFNLIANEVSTNILGRSLSSRHFQGLASAAPVISSSSTLPSDVVRDKPVGGTAKTIVTASPTATTSTTASTSSSPRSPSHRFEEGDMIRIKGVEDTGGGVVRWVGTLPDVVEPVAGLEMDNEWPGGNDGTWKEKSYFKCQMGHGLFMRFSTIMKDPLYCVDSGDEPITVYSNLSTGSPNLYTKSTSVPSHSASIVPPLRHSHSDSRDDVTKTPPRKGTDSTPEKLGSASSSQPLSEQLLSHFHPLSELLSEPSTGDKPTSDVFSDDDGILKVTFPGDCTGLIIGNEGNTIIDIQNESHTTIKVHHNRSDLTANGVAWIMGSKKNCEDALMLMCKKLNEKICRLHAIKETITIPDSSVGRVIGTEGSVKKAIEKLSGVKMKVEQEKDMMLRLFAIEAKVTIQGSEEQIERAKQLIEMAVHGENIVLLQNVLKEVLQVMNAMGFELL